MLTRNKIARLHQLLRYVHDDHIYKSNQAYYVVKLLSGNSRNANKIAKSLGVSVEFMLDIIEKELGDVAYDHPHT